MVALHCGEPRKCRCGQSWGCYRPDGAHVSAGAAVIGIMNHDLHFALVAFINDDPDRGYRTIRAWVMGKDAPRVHWETP